MKIAGKSWSSVTEGRHALVTILLCRSREAGSIGDVAVLVLRARELSCFIAFGVKSRNTGASHFANLSCGCSSVSRAAYRGVACVRPRRAAHCKEDRDREKESENFETRLAVSQQLRSGMARLGNAVPDSGWRRDGFQRSREASRLRPSTLACAFVRDCC